MLINTEIESKITAPEAKLVLLIVEHTVNDNKKAEIEKLVNSNKINWGKFKQFLEYHELMPFAYTAFREISFPSELMNLFRERYYSNLIHNQYMWKEFIRISDVFKKADISLLPIKGVALLEDLYSGNPVRPMTDIDVLIKRVDLSKAYDLFYNLGYNAELRGLRKEYWLNIKGQLPFKMTKGKYSFRVEAHFNFEYRRKGEQFLEQVWGRAKDVNIEQEKYKLLSPEDNLFSLALHQRVFGKALNLKYIIDLALLFRKYGSSFDWNYVVGETRRHKICTSLFFLLSSLDVFGIKVAPLNIYKDLSIPKYKQRLIKSFIRRNTFTDNIISKTNIIYLKSHFLLYDSLWEPVNYIFGISHEHFAMFYNLKPYSKKAKFLYRLRFCVFLKSLLNLSILGLRKNREDSYN